MNRIGGMIEDTRCLLHDQLADAEAYCMAEPPNDFGSGRSTAVPSKPVPLIPIVVRANELASRLQLTLGQIRGEIRAIRSFLPTSDTSLDRPRNPRICLKTRTNTRACSETKPSANLSRIRIHFDHIGELATACMAGRTPLTKFPPAALTWTLAADAFEPFRAIVSHIPDIDRPVDRPVARYGTLADLSTVGPNAQRVLNPYARVIVDDAQSELLDIESVVARFAQAAIEKAAEF